MKRENGTGTIYKASGNRRRPWIALAPAEYSEEKSARKVIGTYATKKEAVHALYEYSLHPTDKFNITLEEAFEEWKETAYKNISEATQANYNAAWLRIRQLGRIKLRELRTAQMQRVINSNAEMSRSTLSKIKILLSQIFDYGMENDICTKNYAHFLTLPKEEKREKEAFSEIEVKKIEEAAAAGVPFADTILILIYTGFRIAEFLELTPFAYNAKNGTLTGGKKTEAGKNRIVPVHDKIRPYVLQWLDKGGQTIICKKDGTPYSVKYFRENCYYPALEQIGVRKLSPHSTRHTMATRLAAAGVRPEEIQKILGHAKYDITADVYIHPEVETLKKAVNSLH